MTHTGIGAYSPCCVGVDGGGSKTLAIVVDANGNECGRATAGSANYQAVGLDRAVAQLTQAVAEAAHIAGCRLPLAAAWLGVAGIDSARDHTTVLPHLRSLAQGVRLTNDAELMLSPLPDSVGVALVAGTGSIALGRNASGATARTGGWGHLLGDEGSGYDIGRHALQAALRAADGRGPATPLLDAILAEWRLSSASDILGRVYPDGDKAEIARLSRVVFATAQAGDRVARGIVRRAASELALAALAVGAGLGVRATDALPLALGGGMLLHEATLQRDVLLRLGRRQALGPVVLVEEPALCAARAARSLPPDTLPTGSW